MLLSLLQSPDRIDTAAESPTDAFVSIVKACATSRVWKVRRDFGLVQSTMLTRAARQIRDAAGDALTGLIPPLEVAGVCVDLLKGVETCPENEVSAEICTAPMSC